MEERNYKLLDQQDEVVERQKWFCLKKRTLAILSILLITMGTGYFRMCGYGMKDIKLVASGPCKKFFDGCNTCVASYPGGAMSCTEKICVTREYVLPKCLEYFDSNDVMIVSKENCQSWFDGCNSCHRGSPSSEFACTKKWCGDKKSEPFCRKAFDTVQEQEPAFDTVQEPFNKKKIRGSAKPTSTAPEDCQVWFDGCNRCRRGDVGGLFACTKMLCHGNKEAKCLKFFEAIEAKVSQAEVAPETCKLWFDGCNNCHRGEPGGPLACTRMACPPGSESNAECKEWF